MDTLPDEIIFKILSNVDTNAIKNFSQTNLYYHNLCQDVYFWSKRFEETTNHRRIVFEELWADIKKYGRKSMTGIDIFKTIIKNKVTYTPSHLEFEYVSFLIGLKNKLNSPSENIKMYTERAILSVIDLYILLKVKFLGTCQHICTRGMLKGQFCGKPTPFGDIYCSICIRYKKCLV